MAKWLLVDGYNMAFRAFYGMPELTRSDGFPTGALHGWVKTMWKLQDQEKPDAMVVFFDLGGSQDRLALHPEYKAQRKETPEPLEKQIPVIKELTRAMGLIGVELDGVESDDLLAAQARALGKAGHDVLIVSADKDFAQCVDERIKILLPPPTANPKLGWRVLDPAGVVEKFGVPPAQIAEYLALIGDTSDNIPGVNGVGAAVPRNLDQLLDVQVALPGGLPTKRVRLVGDPDMQPIEVRFGVDGHTGDPRVLASASNTDGDLPAVGDQNLMHV